MAGMTPIPWPQTGHIPLQTMAVQPNHLDSGVVNGLFRLGAEFSAFI
ncbi:MAG: hypothetical protein ACKO55_07475 [Bacteroidota bacterium]